MPPMVIRIKRIVIQSASAISLSSFRAEQNQIILARDSEESGPRLQGPQREQGAFCNLLLNARALCLVPARTSRTTKQASNSSTDQGRREAAGGHSRVSLNHGSVLPYKRAQPTNLSTVAATQQTK